MPVAGLNRKYHDMKPTKEILAQNEPLEHPSTVKYREQTRGTRYGRRLHGLRNALIWLASRWLL
jgi:hypothetical protein